jgi:retron-type reverse transcriptase
MLTSEKLAAFAGDFGYSAHSVSRLLSRFRIHDPKGLDSARVELRRLAHRAIDAWARTAGREEIPPLTLLRNLIARSSAQDLRVYRLLIDSPDTAALSSDVRAALPGIRAQLGPVPESWRLVEVLLHRNRRPRIAELMETDLLDLPGVVRAVLGVASDRKALSAGRWATILSRFESAAPRPMLPLDELDEIGRSTPFPRLAVRDLARLPLRLRRELLASERARALLLTPSLAARLREDPLAHPDTPEAIEDRLDRLGRKARSAVAHRRMTPELLAWIHSSEVDDERRERLLWDGIAAGRSVAEPQHAYSSLASEQRLSPELRLAFAVLASAPEHRFRTVRASQHRQGIAVHLPAEEWARALVANDDPLKPVVVIRMLALHDRADVLERLVRMRPLPTGSAIAALHEWQKHSPMLVADAAAATPAFADRLFDATLDYEFEPEFIERYLETAPPRRATAWMAERLRSGSASFRRPPVPGLFAVALRRFAERGEMQPVRRVLRAAAEPDPSGGVVVKLVGKPIGKHAVDRRMLLEIVRLQPLLSQNTQGLRRLAELASAWADVWTAALEELRRNRQPVPAPLARLIALGGEEAIWKALRAYPRGFLKPALRHVPLRSVLRVAFEEAEIADAVDRLVPRSRLRAEIPWVREEYADQPSPATAYEVALAFSLRDAAFLLQLARRAGPPSGGEAAGTRFDDLYRTYPLPKRSGGTRLITAPSKGLKRLQRRLLDLGFAEVPLHRAATGFLRGSSTLENARPHVGRQMVVNADIESFFPRTSHAHILRACRKLAGGMLSERAIRFVADLCSYGGGLPIGAPTSPAIGNIVLTPPDRAIDRAAKRFGIAYTRYADDLTFSGGGDCHRILPFVEKVLGGLGYELKRKKINLFRKGRRQVVTGLVVNEKPNLPRRIRRRLRAAVHHRTNGREPHWHRRPMSDEELFGRLAVLNPVQPEEALRLRSALKRARAESPPPEE